MLEQVAVLQTARLTVVPVALEHAPALLAYYQRNAAHLGPWEPTRPSDYFSLGYWELAVRRSVADARDDLGYRFIAFVAAEPELIVATVNLSNVVRGAFSAAHLGYSVDAEHQGSGIGREAVGAVVEHAFGGLRLHRVMANYQPTNERSARLLRRLGFVPEGFAQEYLYIAGAWRDHILTAKRHPDPAFRPEHPR